MLGWFKKPSAPPPVGTSSQAPETGNNWTGEITELADDDEVEDFLMVTDALKARLQEEINQKNELIGNQTTQIERLKSKVDTMEKLHKKELAYHEKLIQQEQEKVSEQARKLQSLDREKQSALKSLAENHKAELETLKSSEVKSKSELARTQSVADTLSSETEKCKNAIESKTKELQQLKEKVASLEDQLLEQKRIAREHESHVASSQVDQAAKQKVQVAEIENQELRGQVSALKQKMITQDKSIEDLRAEKGTLEIKVKLQASEMEQSKKEFQRMQGKEIELNLELNKKRNEISALRSDLIKAAEAECFAQNKLAEEKERMTREIEKLHKGQEALSKTETELKENTAFLVTENEKLKTSIKNMHDSVDEILSSAPTSSPSELHQLQLARYKAKVAKVVKDTPNNVPVKCVRAEECTLYPLLEKKKFAVSKEMSLSRFNEHIRSKLNLRPDQPLSVYVDFAGPIPNSEALDVLHKHCAYEDGFLRLKYSHISK